MPESNLISPLLDGFVMGDPISEHHGIRCCPAMHTETGKKYIVKILSIPASQTNLAALMLAGAFRDRDAALAYFRELAEEVAQDAALLQQLARLEGFVSYEDWQIVPPEDDQACYEVYLLGAYHHTLERCFQKESMTHLRAVNLGIDLCAALSACRKNGYLYVDLKPENVSITDDGEYRICDIGFVRLDSIAYASLPEKYCGAYTAPEIRDAYDALNDTIDIYAAGLILYQAYHGGSLPFSGRAPAEILDPPAYADPEMAEIILKACAPDPKDRWQDPVQMGQALISYMQRTTVNDVPIVPVPEMPEEPEPAEEVSDEPTTEQLLAEVDLALEAAGTIEEAQIVEEALIAEQPVAEEPVAEEPIAEEPVAEEPVAEEPVAEEPVAEEPVAEEPVAEEPETDDDMTAMMAQVDDLISHELPDPATIQESVPESENTVSEAPAEEEAEAAIPVVEAEPEVAVPCEEEYWEEAAPKKKKRRWIWFLILLFLLAGIFFGGQLYYDTCYVQTIHDFSVKGYENQLTVSIRSDIKDSLLTVHCSDTYGSTVSQPVVNGKAHFSNLRPGVRYSVYVTISGFHKLEGDLEDSYTTPSTTTISNISAITGSEDGSVILSFNVQGNDSKEWNVFYWTGTDPERCVTFSGHMTTVTGLTPGCEYTFRFEPVSELYLVGENTVTHTASKVICAQNLAITSANNGKVVVQWSAPEGIAVEKWTVRCYNDAEFSITVDVTDTTVTFENLDFSKAHTIEVTAAGMTQSTRTYLSENPVTIRDVSYEILDYYSLKVNWEFDGVQPAAWLLMYTIDGQTEQAVVKSTENSAVIEQVVPGTDFVFSIRAAGAIMTFDGVAQYDAPEVVEFDGYGIKPKYMQFKMCVPPVGVENWTEANLQKSDYTNDIAAGSSAAFAVTLLHEYDVSEDIIQVMAAVRDKDGNVVSLSVSRHTWISMWYNNFGKLHLPNPNTPGEYVVEIYFNGCFVYNQTFTVH